MARRQPTVCIAMIRRASAGQAQSSNACDSCLRKKGGGGDLQRAMLEMSGKSWLRCSKTVRD